MKAGALVLSGGPPALGVVRSLGRHGIPVWTVVGKGDAKVAGLSRYSARTLHWPDFNQVQQLEFLLEIGDQYGLDGWVLFAADDGRAALMARNRDLLARRFLVPPPDWETMRWAYDKRLTYQLAADLGLNYPRTLYPRNREEAGALQCEFPVILKPAYKQFVNVFTRARAWLAKDRDELLKRYDEAVCLVDPSVVLVQELIIGGGENQYSYAGLHADGRPIASLVARRTRQYPVDFSQGSSYVETIESNEIETAARLLLETIRYSGIVEVEFKYDPRDRKFKLLDVNPRVWGWHTLGGRAGVDFPYLLWRWLQNEPVEDARACPGVKWVRMIRDIPAASSEIWRGHLSPGTYLRSLANVSEFAVFAKDDPLPALLEIPLLLASKCSRLGSPQAMRPFYQ
jgi:D-aspartate ligase